MLQKLEPVSAGLETPFKFSFFLDHLCQKFVFFSFSLFGGTE
jgi:hypothetical protein